MFSSAFFSGALLLACVLSSTTQATSADQRDGSEGIPENRLLAEADSMIYDAEQDRIIALGHVVITYQIYTLTAARVEVDRKSGRVRASGDVSIKDASGNTVSAAAIDLTDDLREGVAEGLEVITEERIAFLATRAERSGGDTTVFDEGTYLPCVNCDGVEGRKPIWQIRARKIIHRQKEKSITFEDARFEFMGVPLAWVPVLTQPDPTVRRKSGFLIPEFSYNLERGMGVAAPYFYVLAPNMDVTVTPGAYSKQGAFLDVEWRHRLVDGSYFIRAAGLRQERPEEFSGTSGAREWRGALSSGGAFRLNERWTWGWNLAAASDRAFFDDYDREEGDDDITNDVFLSGVDGRNRFDAHAYGFFVQQEDSRDAKAPAQEKDLQSKQPFVHPVVDHQIYLEEPVAGGELSFTTNFTSLSRTNRDIYEFDADGDGLYGKADPDGERTRLRAAAGNFSRLSVDALWRRRFVDQLGQTLTPFASMRGDVLFSAPVDGQAVGLESNELGLRAMPAVGLEYSYPVLVEAPNLTNVIEPVAQFIVRPNESETGDFSNEDAQSLVFDTTTLFDYDKFSGYDRVEGGTRLNLGLRYTGRLASGASLTAVAGRSLHLAGKNSFATETDYQTGKESGLDSRASDYVTSLSLNTNQGLLLNGAARFDSLDGSANRIEGQMIGLAGPLTTALTYAYIREQPELGIEEARTEVQAAANLSLAEHWRLFGATRFDIENENFVRNAVGLAYDTEAFSMSVSYSEDKTRATGEPIDRTLYLRLGLRTLGEAQGSGDILR